MYLKKTTRALKFGLLIVCEFFSFYLKKKAACSLLLSGFI